MQRRIVFQALLATATALSARGQSSSYFKWLPFRTAAISADGLTVVGEEGMLWTEAGGLESLGALPGATWTVAQGVSGDGTFVVGFSGDESFLWSRATGMVSLGSHPPGVRSVARGVSDDGRVVIGSIGNGTNSEAYRWTDSTGIVGLGQLPGASYPQSHGMGVSRDGAVAVTPSYSACWPDSYQPAIWTESGGMMGLGALPGARRCGGFAFGISPDGTAVAGWAVGATPLTRAYRWTAATGMIELGILEGSEGEYGGLSDGGEVIVGDTLTSSDPVFIWDAAGGMRSLKEELQIVHGLNLTGVMLDRAEGISADGRTIVGTGEDASGTYGGWIAYLGDGACAADCDADGDLTFFDFLCFQNLFAAVDPGADCDGDGDLSFFDFLCFQNAFAAGCP